MVEADTISIGCNNEPERGGSPPPPEYPVVIPDDDAEGKERGSIRSIRIEPDSSGSELDVSSTGEETSDLTFTPKKGPQIYAAVAANFGSFSMGTVVSWTATGLPAIRSSGQIEELTLGQESWIGSIMMLGALLSCPIIGFSLQKFGRRSTILAITLPYLIGWLLIGFGQNLAMLLTGRFMTGFCMGGLSIAVPIYISETAHHSIRGCLASGFEMFLTIGILYIYLIGTYASFQMQAFACAIIPIATHLLMVFAPESPRFLIEKGKPEEALKTLCGLRGASHAKQVDEELQEITDAVEESRKVVIEFSNWRELFTKPLMLPVAILLALLFFQQASAIDGVTMYTVDIFNSTGTHIDENLATNIVGAMELVFTIIAMSVVDRCGRRFLLMTSYLCMGLSLGALGLYFNLKHSGNAAHLSWLPLTSLLIYNVSYSLGCGPVTWLIMGEILPQKIKGPASGLVSVLRWVLAFFLTIIFKDMMVHFGEDISYWIFAVLCFVGLLFTFFWLPETKGITLEEIQRNFNPKLKELDQEILKDKNDNGFIKLSF